MLEAKFGDDPHGVLNLYSFVLFINLSSLSQVYMIRYYEKRDCFWRYNHPRNKSEGL